MTAFQISSSWLSKAGESEVDVTMARLRIIVGDKNVAQFVDEAGAKSDQLHIPAYFLAEWFAENWWPLLWEPRKNEEGPDDAAFISRHSILSAQHGFALPQLSFVPTGRTIRIVARARDASFADVRFRVSSQAAPLRDDVENELRKFVTAVCSRLDQCSVKDSDLQQAWQLVTDVADDEVQFCRFAGALGLSPFEVSEAIAEALDRLSSKLGDRLLMDLCLVAEPQNFESIAGAAELAYDSLSGAETSTLVPLQNIIVPADNFATQAWQRGVQAAKRLRNRLGIKDTDPAGASRIFEELKIDTNRQLNDKGAIEIGLSGAVARDDSEIRVALLQPDIVKRRFGGARAIFTAWTAETQERRFLTSAVTRDQQASRAFAAELTAPLSLLRARARHSVLSQDQIFELANELQIGSDVVSKQALNNGLQVRPL